MVFTQGKTDCSPQEVGYNGQRLEVLNRHLQRFIDKGEIQCATYCISRKGKVFAHGAIGKKSFRAEDPAPVLPDSIRYIASITKVFTAVAIMKLVEDGVTLLDEQVGEILPQFNTAPYNKITLFHLLTHTSGLHADSGCFENKYQTDYWQMIDQAWERRKPEDGEFDWIAAALGTIGSGLRTVPGTEWAYCSFGFTILGAVIEKLTGIHAHQYIEDNICKPLGLNDTSFRITPEAARRYIVTKEQGEKNINNIINGIEDTHPLWDRIPSTGGGLESTAWDIARFGNMMLHGGTFGGVRILGRKAVEKMTRIAIHAPNYTWGANNPNRIYGVGVDLRDDPSFTSSPGTFSHEGAGACSLYIDPEEELTAAWIVPYAKTDWCRPALYNVVNVIWSGIM